MFDVYKYDENDEFVDMVPDVKGSFYKAVANQLVSEGYSIKVVDQRDGVIVYTLDAVL